MIKIKKPDKLPALECFIGETSAHTYRGKSKRKDLDHWLQSLVVKHSEQLQDATEDVVEKAVSIYNTTILAFPDHHRHHDIEEMVFQISEAMPDCKAFVIHQYALNAGDMKRLYKVTDVPSVLVITKDKFRRDKRVHRLYAKQHLTRQILETHILARGLNATHYNDDEFEKDIMTLRGTRYFPKIITFYAYWGRHVKDYLTALRRSIEEFTEVDLPMRFGLMDLTDDTSKKTISRWIQADYVKKVPFTVAFFTDAKNSKLLQLGLNEDRPTPMSLFPLIQKTGEDLTDIKGDPLVYQPCGTEDPLQITPLYEGPFGSMCSSWSHNQTNNTPVPIKKTKVKKHRISKAKEKRNWHEKFGTDLIDEKLRKVNGIPVISSTTWSEVIEKSHAPNHPFLGGQQWAGEVTKVALVIFIQADCGSCNRNMETFKQLQQSVKYIEGGSLYLVNCTTDTSLCNTHNIKGYPYIIAYRGLGWMGTTSCLSPQSQDKYRKYVRMDYHGVIQEKAIMEWFTNAAASAITNNYFVWPDKSKMEIAIFQVEDVRLIGVVIPKMSRYLPIPPNRNRNYYYSYECFRLVCERLYSRAKCYGVYSLEIPTSEYTDSNTEVIVSRVVMERRDGVRADLTYLGQSLMDTMEDQEDSILHRFHKPHRYNLKPSQKCEDDHGICTDLITDFTLDHSRLPITHITSDAFHTDDRLSDEELPVLIALVHQENITKNSPFLEIVVTTLDVDQYPAWAGQFVPRNYGRTMIREDGDPDKMYEYPRICIVKRSNHHKAVFYPPVGEHVDQKTVFSRKRLKSYLLKVLRDLDDHFITTEHF
ncbi:hypothetical protein FSP39_002676 [Pinctada imbricata]|uniref:Thioredoxin domain-containing protein n=1 Tax=Pinctada imbricata TaxID=66713 RepID=A0AA88XPC9_PINIB|nr:hypothetical protein FSP39_002676 [Pinctada imbricata]